MKKLMLIALIGLCGNAVFAQKSGKKLSVTEKSSPALESKSTTTDGLWISITESNNASSTQNSNSEWKAISPNRKEVAPKKMEK